LNHRPRSSELTLFKKQPNIFFDTARIEGTDGIATLIRRVSPQRVMLGTHAPFLIPEAALIRVLESKLSIEEQEPLLYQSAQKLLTSSRVKS
jgi:predicted TIM-barrel fold metal-dependent hydrolase